MHYRIIKGQLERRQPKADTARYRARAMLKRLSVNREAEEGAILGTIQ